MYNIAEQIIQKLGGAKRVADITGVDITRIYRWTYPKERGGTDGLIPTRHLSVLINAANADGIALTLSDIVGVESIIGKRKKVRQ